MDTHNFSLGVGILSWKGGETLKHSLESYHQSGLFSLCAQKLVFLPEQRHIEMQIAQQYPVEIYGHPNNLGILGGFEAIADLLKTEYILILENDFHIHTTPEDVQHQIMMAHHLLASHKADIIRLRSRHNPGEPFCGQDKYKKYLPDHHAPLIHKFCAAMMRMILPFHSRKTLGMMFYDLEKNIEHYPNIFQFYQNIPITDSRYLPWTNNPSLVRRDFLLENVLEFAQNYRSKRRINGFKNIEIETNSYQWRKNKYKIALPDGLFTHNRLGDRGY